MAFDRDSDWRTFLSLVTTAKPEDAPEISARAGVGPSVVLGYMDQVHGYEMLKKFGNIRADLAPHAVGFRYRALGRWVTTERIRCAQRDYDAGLVEVVTGLFAVRGEPAWVLFAIPRKTPAKRKEAYFG